MGYQRRRLLTAALTANAIRPVPGYRASIPAFFAGWLTGELAPHVLATTAADTAWHLARGRRDTRALALAGLTAAGLVHLIRQAQDSARVAEEALTEGLGVDYAAVLDPAPTPADLAVPWRRVARPFRVPYDGVVVERDIAYTEHGRRGLLDVYRPAVVAPGAPAAPVLLQIHGGAWTIGKKEEQGLPLMTHLAARGWVCVAINYRLSPRDAWPAHIVDVKRAIAWIRAHIGEYGGDPAYLAVTGGSAGGHLTALAALTPGEAAWQPGFEDVDTSVQVAVPHYGVYDMAGTLTGPVAGPNGRRMRDGFLAPRIFQRRYREDPAVFHDASPLEHVTDRAPDMFVIHGRLDTLVPVDHARELVARLRATSRRSVVYAELPGTQHGFDVFASVRSQHVVRAVERYLNWHWTTWRSGLGAARPDAGDDWVKTTS
ncbi:alpha/beta hydrolase fold domain-containing protein [Nocardioides sp.]|uniref:alpha/beta hydrolase fold domain-containing protein n=1 Tax=Nocardioides sp. TaxID=35761 RepID=UPI003518FF75